MKKLLILFFVSINLTFAQSLTITPNSGSNSEVLKITKLGIGLDHRVTGNLVGVGTYVNGSFGILQTHTNHPLGFATNNGSIRAILQTNGNFGLGGITDPQYFLDVNGRARIRYNVNTAGIWFSKTNNNANEGSFFGNINDASAGIFIGNDWRFGVNDAGTVWIPNLAGSGTRPVGADANGNLVPMAANATVAFSAYRGNSFSITNFAELVYNIEEFDLSNNYDTGTGIFTAPVSGIYNCTATVTWQDSFTGERSINIQKFNNQVWSNIKSKFIPNGQNASNADDNTDDVSGLVQLNANDQLRVMALQSSGSPRAVAPTSNLTYFSCFKVN
jgi:hypothetical protein